MVHSVLVFVTESFPSATLILPFSLSLKISGPLEANNFAMLGLGDIVVPGIFIALLLRFDISRDGHKNGSKVSMTLPGYHLSGALD